MELSDSARRVFTATTNKNRSPKKNKMKKKLLILSTIGGVLLAVGQTTYGQTVQESIDKLSANAAALESIINGPATGTGSTVTLPLGGTQDSLAKAFAQFDNANNLSFASSQSLSLSQRVQLGANWPEATSENQGALNILVMGQSNASRSNFGVADFDMTSNTNVKTFNNSPASTGGSGTWVTWVPTGPYQTLSNASTTPSTTPAFHLGKALQELTGREIRVSLIALGGQSLPWMSAGGTGWDQLLDHINRGVIAKYDAVFLMQGEAENSGSDTQHLTRLATWVSDLRALAQVDETTPIVLAGVNNQYTDSNRRMQEFANVNSAVRFVGQSKDLPMLADGVHFTNNSCVYIGREVMFQGLFKSGVASLDEVNNSRSIVFTGSQYVTLPAGLKTTLAATGATGLTFRTRFRPDFDNRQDGVNYGGAGYYIVELDGATDAAFGVLHSNSTVLTVWVNDYAQRANYNIPPAFIDSGKTGDLAITWNEADGSLKLFLDGAQITATTGAAFNTAYTGDLPTISGNARLYGEGNGTRHAISVVKWAAFWDTALPDATFTTPSHGLPDITAAKAAYEFVTPPIQRLFDASGNAQHGTWVGAGAYARWVN
tara:strand:- start:5305 stop:7110 length:1806 start_codon:yes stop_codon:yes gene_type:complete